MTDSAATLAQLQAENETLRARVAALEQELAARTAEAQRFRTLADSAMDGINITDMDGRIIYANDALRAMSGYGAQLTDMTLAEFYRPEEFERAQRLALPAILEHNTWQGLAYPRRADGSLWTAQVSLALLRDADGRPATVSAITRDISAQQAQEQRLRRFEALVENADDGMLLITPDGAITYANPTFCTMLLSSAAAVQGRNIMELLANITVDDFARIGEPISQGQPWRGLLHHRRSDGTSFPAQVSVAPIRAPDGTITTVAIVRDISAQHAQEQRLRRFAAIVENSPDCVIVGDLTTQLPIYINKAFTQAIGYTAEEVVGRLGIDLFAADPAAVYATMPELMAKGYWRGDRRYRRKDGSTFAADMLAFTIYDPNGQPEGVVGIFHDITAAQQAEQERRDLQQQLIDAQQAALRELSTPLIPLAADVIALPLIGAIDSARAQQILETLLAGISSNHARYAILDITGVQVVDTQVAGALLRAAQAVQLLGAQVVLTGIRPEVAQTLVSLGVDLRQIVTRATMQSGIAYALARRGSGD